MNDRGDIVARNPKIRELKATQQNSTAKIVAEVLEIRRLRRRKGNINAEKRKYFLKIFVYLVDILLCMKLLWIILCFYP